MTAIFVSDVHLRDSDSVKSRLFCRFLQEKASQYEKIYILGDLFDVWPGTNEFLKTNYRSILDVLGSLVKAGHKLHYLEGNHDFKLGNYFTETLGISVYPNQIIENWNGRKIFMAHGDMGNPKDYGSRALRYLLRRDVLHLALNSIPSEWIFRVGLRSSQLSRKYQTKVPTKTETQIRQIYRQTAENIFNRGYDVVIMGHTHLPDDVSTLIGGRHCRYINTGDWVKNFTYLEFDGKEFYTRTHPVKANGDNSLF